MNASIKSGPDGAKLAGLRPEMCIAFTVINSIFADHGIPCTITEGTGGKHMVGSLHYKGLALDIRLPSFYVGKSSGGIDFKIMSEIKDALGSQYDVLIESSNTHIHVEFDPKEGVA